MHTEIEENESERENLRKCTGHFFLGFLEIGNFCSDFRK